MAQELHSTVTSTLDPPPLPPLTDQPVWPQPRVGAFWGEDMILTAAVLRDTRFATALTYVEVVALERVDLFGVLEDFPTSRRVVQDAAIRMAVKRTVVLLKAYADAQRISSGKSPNGCARSCRDSAAEDAGPSLASPPTAEGVSSRAYTMLTAAFTPAESLAGGGTDLGKIFRTTTGSKLRDVDANGNLVEQVSLTLCGHANPTPTVLQYCNIVDKSRIC